MALQTFALSSTAIVKPLATYALDYTAWLNQWMAGGGGGVVFPPQVSGTNATIAADFAGNQYWASAATQASFAAWLTAIGGTYSRSSTATYLQGGVVKTATANTPRFPTDLAGVGQGIRLTGAATNIQIQSSDLSQATPWLLQLSSLVTGQPDPAGGNTAVKVIPNAGLGTNKGLYDNFNPGFSATNWTISAFVKNAGYNFLVIDFCNTDVQQVCVDLTTGVVSTIGTVTAAGAIALANGWWLVYITAVPSATGNNPPSFRMSDARRSGSIAFTADGVSGVSMWGVQITNTAFPCDYIPTTAATVTQAADSLTFPFASSAYSALVNVQDQRNPGQTLLLDDNSGYTISYWTNVPPESIYTFNGSAVLQGPVLLPLSGVNKAMLAGNASGRKITANGNVPATDANALSATATQNVAGTGHPTLAAYGNFSQLALWNGIVASTAEMQRLTALPPLTVASASINADFAGNTYAVAGAAKADFAAWLTAIGGTYSRSSTATYLQGGVVKTATANAPRFPTDLAGTAQGVRLTGAATNLTLWSQDLTNAAWTGSGPFVANAAAAPDGTNTATRFIPAAGAATTCFVQQSSTVINGSAYTDSIFVKPIGAFRYLYLYVADAGSTQVWFDLVNGTIGTTGSVTPSITPLANGWFKISASKTVSGTSLFLSVRLADADASTTFTGDGVKGVYLWGGQITNTAFPADYIPTTTATVTQAADTLNFPYTQTTFSALMGTNNQLVGGFAALMGIGGGEALAIDNAPLYGVWTGTVLVSGPTMTGTKLDPHKGMSAGSPSGVSVTGDGLVPVTNVAAFVITPTVMSLGAAGGNPTSYGNISQFALWNGIVASNADMQRLTT